jgi:hypothetical protein
MRAVLPVLVLPLTLLAARPEESGPVAVRLVPTAQGHQLQRNGSPYFIRGVGGKSHLDLLARVGGNSVRTWGTDGLGPLLDECQRLGLTVAVGLWLGHERHGFNYNDADQVAGQIETVRQAVLHYKDHPAVLLWGLGNEMEGYERGDNAAIWSAINNLATLVKRLDPNHPTMTVVAEIGGDRVKNVHRLCPDIDVVGINSYGGAARLPERYQAAGGTKPFLITEYGPPGSWESGKTPWGTPVELTSTAKADRYRQAYERGILGAPGRCLGGYAFLWGQKQEATATWFGLLTADGRRLGGVDVLQEFWSGRPPANRCPRIEALRLEGADQVAPGATVKAVLTATDPEGDPLQVRWVLQAEPTAYAAGGDAEEVPPTFPEAIVQGDLRGAEVKMPAGGGGYRLFAHVTDDHGGAAVANVPLRVDAPVLPPKARAAQLPLVVYAEATDAKPPFAPTGWMGNTKGLRLDPACATNPHGGKTCLHAEYRDGDGWAGVVWQSPPGDWGDRPGGWDLTGAKQLTFWARGGAGGEVVSFEFGLLGAGKKFPDTARGKLADVALTAEWKAYALPLGAQDLSRIKTGFAFVVRGQGKPVEFFLDDVRFE